MVSNFLEAHALSMALPAQMAFVALVGQGMLDRYPDMKIGFMEFGAEWIFYMAGRIDHYLERDRFIQPPALSENLPKRFVRDYFKSGRVFMCGEMEDQLMQQEIELLGEDQLLFSSDYPHGEARDDAAATLIERGDLADIQKQKILYDNPARFYGEP
jgi:predicted TIM-barrel fold metal-dependent hydrolase